MPNSLGSIRGRRYRRRLARDSRGVVSVVGTLLALLVFFALFGIFLTSYVPLWMNDNEAQFTNQVQASFADLQSNMNLQATLGTAPVFSTPFVMASQGIPLLAQPTSGVMNFVPVSAGIFTNVSMTVGPGGGKAFWENDSLGTLRMTLQNRYYSPELFEMEDGAVIQSQGDTHQVMAFPPPLALNVSGTSVGVTVAIVQMVGNATQAISTGTIQVYSHFLTTQTYFSNGGGSPFNAKFKLGTHYACAWQSYLNTTVRQADLPHGVATLTPTACEPSQAGNGVVVALSFTGITYLRLIVASFQMDIGVGVE